MPKEPKPNFASFTKAELVKTVKKLDARQTKLLNRIAELEHKLFVAIGNAALPPDLTEANMLRVAEEHYGDAGVVPPFCPLCDVNTKPPNCEVEGCPNATRDEWEREMPKPAFPWEKD